MEQQTIREQLRSEELLRRDENAKTTDFDKPVAIVRDGNTIMIPPSMRPEKAVEWVTKWATAENKIVTVDQYIDGVPIDAANALMLAVKHEFGVTELQSTPGFFGDAPPAFIAVPIDHLGNTTEVYVGRMGLPGFENGWIHSLPDDMKLRVHGKIKQKDVPLFNQLLGTARKFLATKSLYKGRAITLDWSNNKEDGDGNEMVLPTFWDVSTEKNLIIDRVTEGLIDATIWTPMRKMEWCKRFKIPIKRGVMLYGTYGTGKTLCAGKTAQIAVENGFTFVYMKDLSNLSKGIEFVSKHYMPAVLFIEDTERAFDDPSRVQDLQNTMDGIDSKDRDLIVIMTTNHHEKVPTGMLRPGRIDTLIHMRAPDAETAARLVTLYAGELLDPNSNMQLIGDAIAGNIPAVIREIVERSKLFAIARSHVGTPLTINHEDVVLAARGMLEHMEFLRQGTKTPPSAVEMFGTALGGEIAQGVMLGIKSIVDQSAMEREGNSSVNHHERLLIPQD